LRKENMPGILYLDPVTSCLDEVGSEVSRLFCWWCLCAVKLRIRKAHSSDKTAAPAIRLHPDLVCHFLMLACGFTIHGTLIATA
jgi:hypothetical protein